MEEKYFWQIIRSTARKEVYRQPELGRIPRKRCYSLSTSAYLQTINTFIMTQQFLQQQPIVSVAHGHRTVTRSAAYYPPRPIRSCC